MEEKIFQEILKQVHEEPLYDKYIPTAISQNLNCYSHALGATYPNLQSYRIGAICEKKPLDQEYFSIDEIKELLFLDCEKLQLKIEESSLEEELLPNQYKIQLYVKIWGNGQIGDYHFLICLYIFLYFLFLFLLKYIYINYFYKNVLKSNSKNIIDKKEKGS